MYSVPVGEAHFCLPLLLIFAEGLEEIKKMSDSYNIHYIEMNISLVVDSDSMYLNLQDAFSL